MRKPQKPWFLGGLIIYLTSFFLNAVGGLPAGQPIRGFVSAYLALLSWLNMGLMRQGHAFADKRLAFVCLMVSGLINPAFLLYVIEPSKIFRRVLLLMIPSCWIFFYYEHLIPHEGHFLWILGMLLVLYGARPAKLCQRKAEDFALRGPFAPIPRRFRA
jgi:hypothetical protein